MSLQNKKDQNSFTMPELSLGETVWNPPFNFVSSMKLLSSEKPFYEPFKQHCNKDSLFKFDIRKMNADNTKLLHFMKWKIPKAADFPSAFQGICCWFELQMLCNAELKERKHYFQLTWAPPCFYKKEHKCVCGFYSPQK